MDHLLGNDSDKNVHDMAKYEGSRPKIERMGANQKLLRKIRIIIIILAIPRILPL